MRALAIVVLLTAVAAAEPEAERLYKEGQSAYDAQRYDDALAAWNKSYELSHLPGLVFNIAQAHRLRGDCAKAVEAYKKFIALDPKSSERSTAEGFIKDLSPCPWDKSASGASSSGAKPSGANTSGANTGGTNPSGANTGGANTGGANTGGAKLTTGSSPNASNGTTGTNGAGTNGAGTNGAGTNAAGTNGASTNGTNGVSNGASGSSNAVDTGHGKRIAGLAFVGGGVAIAATGVYFGSRAQALADDVRKACGTSCAYPSIRDKDQEGRRDETIQWILYGAGAAAVVTGGILYLTGKRTSSVAVAPHGDGAVVTLSGRW